MKLTSTIPLFCVALLGYLSFTLQSNATSIGETAAESSGRQGTKCPFNDVIDWVMVYSDDKHVSIPPENVNLM